MKAPMQATARAGANIALAKYWGKSDRRLNLPAVPSISLTLEELSTTTRVRFDRSLEADTLVLNGRETHGRQAERAFALIHRLRRAAKTRVPVCIESTNNFPTAAGLASSASGFAALAAAGAHALGLDWNERQWSAAARRASASAARSIFGGYVELPAGRPGHEALCAKPVAPPEHWDLRLLLALTTEEAKEVGSTDAMEHARRSSPFYRSWLEVAPQLTRTIRRAILERDLERLGPAMEQSTLAFHACGLAASPAILYWNPTTVAALATVQALRQAGTPVWATMDAGPHVKALCSPRHASRVRKALEATPGVLRVVVSRPGRGVEVS